VRAIPVGKGEVLREGARVALVGYGSGVAKALEAADLLAERDDLEATVVDARFAKPLDVELMTTLAGDHELLVTVEEGVLAGGFGSAVWEALNDRGVAVARMLRVGLPDRYVTHGKPALLHAEVGFTGRDIARRVESALFAGRGEVLSEA
jgi:1-deoxy-D-xylulose-5-phosphate synthase